jgi:phytoene synthase
MDTSTDLDGPALDAAVRAADPDRWLASRFIADAGLRADVIAIYAFDHELRRVREVATEPLMAEIRLTWWREALDEILDGKAARGHPTLVALAGAIGRHGLDAAALRSMVEARLTALDGVDVDDATVLDRHIDWTAGAVMALALTVLGHPGAAPFRHLAEAWWIAEQVRGGARAPALVARGRAALAKGRAAVRGLPPQAFAAVAYVALAGPYLARRSPGPLEARLRVLGAVISGRV